VKIVQRNTQDLIEAEYNPRSLSDAQRQHLTEQDASKVFETGVTK